MLKIKSELYKGLKMTSRVLALTVIILLLTIPVAHYYVPTPRVSDKEIEQARSNPKLSVLNELDSFFPAWSLIGLKSKLIADAQNIVDGVYLPPGFPEKILHLPPNLESFEKSPRSDLFMARLAIADILIDAFAVSGKDKYLILAKDLAVSFSGMEQKLWLNHGLIWNDHAIAERVMVVIKIWRSYREHDSFNPTDAKSIIQLVIRSARLLSKPSLYNARTNHGIMQNLALLQICIAFPDMDNVESMKKRAYNRLNAMMPHYLSSEGVILEHSAGYHQKGLELIGKMLRYFTILQLPIPNDLAERYEKAKRFYANIRRPDGSLPKFGDTSGWEDKAGPLVTYLDDNGKYLKLSHRLWRPFDAASCYPDSGYAVWWGGLANYPFLKGLNQTVIVWSYFPSNAHKNADELSIILWADGQDWLTNAGYYPFGSATRLKAISWEGSNAPHLVGEPFNSERSTCLLNYVNAEGLKMIDLERSGPEKFKARRQLLFLENAGLWIAVDSTEGAPKDQTRTIWKGANSTTLDSGENNSSFVFRGKDKKTYLNVYIIARNNLKLEKIKGNQAPFAGWDGTRPAPALMVTQPASNSMTVTAFLLDHTYNLSPDGLKSIKADLTDPQNWSVRLPMPKGQMKIHRRSSELSVNDISYSIENPVNIDIPSNNPSMQNKAAMSPSVKLRLEILAFVVSKKFIWIASLLVILTILIQEALIWFYYNHHLKRIEVFSSVMSVTWGVVFLATLSLNVMLIMPN